MTIRSKAQPLSETVSQTEKPAIPNEPQNRAKNKTDTASLNRNLLITGELETHPVNLLIDTGACVSAIDEKLVKEIHGIGYSAKMTDGPLPSVSTISGERVPVLGQIQLPLKLNGVMYNSQFHVIPNFPYEAILGHDFLLKNDAVIDLRNKCVSLKNNHCQIKEPSDPKSNRVIATYTSGSSKFSSEVETNCDDQEKTQGTTRPRESITSRRAHGSLASSFLVFVLVVLYLCLTSQAQRFERTQPVVKRVNKRCYSVERKGAKSASEAFMQLCGQDSENLNTTCLILIPPLSRLKSKFSYLTDVRQQSGMDTFLEVSGNKLITKERESPSTEKPYLQAETQTLSLQRVR